jgi:hypothetical protein
MSEFEGHGINCLENSDAWPNPINALTVSMNNTHTWIQGTEHQNLAGKQCHINFANADMFNCHMSICHDDTKAIAGVGQLVPTRKTAISNDESFTDDTTLGVDLSHVSSPTLDTEVSMDNNINMIVHNIPIENGDMGKQTNCLTQKLKSTSVNKPNHEIISLQTNTPMVHKLLVPGDTQPNSQITKHPQHLIPTSSIQLDNQAVVLSEGRVTTDGNELTDHKACLYQITDLKNDEVIGLHERIFPNGDSEPDDQIVEFTNEQDIQMTEFHEEHISIGLDESDGQLISLLKPVSMWGLDLDDQPFGFRQSHVKMESNKPTSQMVKIAKPKAKVSKQYQCSACDKSYANRSSLYRHKRKCLTCTMCHRDFGTKDEFRLHMMH